MAQSLFADLSRLILGRLQRKSKMRFCLGKGKYSPKTAIQGNDPNGRKSWKTDFVMRCVFSIAGHQRSSKCRYAYVGSRNVILNHGSSRYVVKA